MVVENLRVKKRGGATLVQGEDPRHPVDASGAPSFHHIMPKNIKRTPIKYFKY